MPENSLAIATEIMFFLKMVSLRLDAKLDISVSLARSSLLPTRTNHFHNDTECYPRVQALRFNDPGCRPYT